jgi:hypothetical protein
MRECTGLASSSSSAMEQTEWLQETCRVQLGHKKQISFMNHKINVELESEALAQIKMAAAAARDDCKSSTMRNLQICCNKCCTAGTERTPVFQFEVKDQACETRLSTTVG